MLALPGSDRDTGLEPPLLVSSSYSCFGFGIHKVPNAKCALDDIELINEEVMCRCYIGAKGLHCRCLILCKVGTWY